MGRVEKFHKPSRNENQTERGGIEMRREYPENILSDVRNNLGAYEDGANLKEIDEEISQMSPGEVFERVLVWNGLIDYKGTIRRWIRGIYGLDIEAGDKHKRETVWRIQDDDLHAVMEDKFPDFTMEQCQKAIDLARERFSVSGWEEMVEAFIEVNKDEITGGE
jgi:hypothetical protein